MAKTLQNPRLTDPKKEAPTPEFPKQTQTTYPGSPSEMSPKPDHGEESYVGLGRLEGRSALITGGDSGIGRAVAIAFAREGADVAISYLPEEEEDAAETCEWITRAGRKAVRLPGDIREEKQCREIANRTFDELG